MKEGLERFIEDNYSNILREYIQLLRRDVIPKVGTTVELRKKRTLWTIYWKCSQDKGSYLNWLAPYCT